MRQSPPRWTAEQLDDARQQAIAIFREQRMHEPLEKYLDVFASVRAAVAELLDTSGDLSQLDARAVEVLSDPAPLEAVRYLTGPPISLDDLKVLADASLSPKVLQADPAMARWVIDTVLLGLDRNRFPWVAENRNPTESERQVATIASAALVASRRVMTVRANESKEEQESAVATRLREEGFHEVSPRIIPTVDQAPNPGEFCRESLFGSRKADIVVRLWDHRMNEGMALMPCVPQRECV